MRGMRAGPAGRSVLVLFTSARGIEAAYAEAGALVRGTKELLDAFYSVVNEGTRTLSAADAQGRKRWWKGLIRMDRRVLEVGFVFDLRSQRSPMGEHLGRYRLVAMAIAPEGYLAVVGYEDDWQPANGRPVPEVDLTQLVPS